jgi:hypothetical protein
MPFISDIAPIDNSSPHQVDQTASRWESRTWIPGKMLIARENMILPLGICLEGICFSRVASLAGRGTGREGG